MVIGSGSAAFAAAIKAVDFGATVAMIERKGIGGTCVNVGCVPSKHLLTLGEHYFYQKNGTFRGLRFNQVEFNLAAAIQQKDRLVEELRTRKYVDVVNSLEGVTFIQGNAVFLSETELRVDGEKITGKKFIIATGSSPAITPIKGINDLGYLTNVEALDLQKRPGSMLVVGGGALGLEFAQMYRHFGTQVTVLELLPRILPEEEPEISEALKMYLQEEGIQIHTGAVVKEAAKVDGTKRLTAEIDGERRSFSAEEVLLATGRRPNTFGIGLERTGVRLGKNGAALVDQELRTTAPHIWAAGDVIGEPMLETVAAKEGAIAAENALGGKGRKIDFSAVPHAVFTSPQVASVGMTEEKVMEKFHVCSCRVLNMSLVPKAMIIGDTRGLVKMVVHPKTLRILGVHVLSQQAADIIHEGVLAVQFQLTIDNIIDTVHVFPTMAESIKLVAQSFRKDVSRLSCCTE